VCCRLQGVCGVERGRAGHSKSCVHERGWEGRAFLSSNTHLHTTQTHYRTNTSCRQGGQHDKARRHTALLLALVYDAISRPLVAIVIKTSPVERRVPGCKVA